MNLSIDSFHIICIKYINNYVNYYYDDVRINYKFINNGGVVNVFLHGWGRSSSDFYEIIKDLNIKSWLSIDFPPFGKSDEPKNWSVFTYANMLISLLRRLKIEKVNLIGHSFGGRVAIIVAGMEKNMVEKLILVDSAGMKPKRNLKTRYQILKYKVFKKMRFNTSKFGSTDYKNLSENMKRVFSNIVNTNLQGL